MPNIQIIEYDPSHAKALTDMWNHSSWMGEKISETEQSVLAAEGTSAYLNLYLAKMDDLIVGYCKLGNYQREAKTLYIDGLMVRTDYQGRKVGKALLLKCVERTVELGYPRLDLYTWAGNTKAIPLYKKCGFFWEEIEDSVHLMNFIPEVLAVELFTDFFQQADWYNHSTRPIDTLLDGRKENGFEIFRYAWAENNRQLIVDYTARGRGIKRVETEDYIIDTRIANLNLPFGKSYECVYQIINKTGKELIVEISGQSDKNIKYDYHNEFKVSGTELVKTEFYLDAIEYEYSDWKTHPAVTAEIKVNGKTVPFRTGIAPKFPLQITAARDDDRENFRERNLQFYLNLTNNFDGRVSYKFKLKSTDCIQILNPLVDITLVKDQKSVICIEYLAHNAGYYLDNLVVTATPENGLPFSFNKEIRNPVYTENGVFFQESSEVCRGGNNAIALYYDKEENYLMCHDITNYHYGYIEYVQPSLGRPFSQEFETKKAAKIEHRIENGVLFVSFHYESDAFPGIEVIDHLCLNSDRSAERYYQVINHGDQDQKIVLKDHYDYNGPGQCLSYNNHVLNEFSSCINEENITENWFFAGAEYNNSFVSFCWPKDSKPSFKDGGIFFEIDCGILKPGATMTSASITSCIAKHRKFEQLRKYAAQKYDLKYDPSFSEDNFYELSVNNGNPFALNLQAAVKNSSDQPLDGEFALYCADEKLSELSVSADDCKTSAQFELTANPAEEITLLRAEFCLSELEFTDSKAVFRVGEQLVKTGLSEIDDQQILEADNGLIKIKTAPDFAPNIFSLEYQGREWLHSSFPQPRANTLWNPWLGGIMDYCISVVETGKLLEEKSVTEFVSVKDSLNNLWQGIMIKTEILKNKKYQGLVQTQYFLMLPDSPVVATYLKVENFANVHLDLLAVNESFFRFNKESRVGIKNIRNQQVWLKTSVGDQLIFIDHAVFKHGDRKEKLVVFNTNRQPNNRCAGADDAFYTQFRKFTTIRNNEILILPPVFYILSEKDFQNSELRDLYNVRFPV